MNIRNKPGIATTAARITRAMLIINANSMLSFFHNSDDLIHTFKPHSTQKPLFYWFNDLYYNHNSFKTPDKYFYLFIKNPKEDGIQLRARHEGLDFNGLYKDWVWYLEGREKNFSKGLYNYFTPQPGILMSFSEIEPELIAKFIDDEYRKVRVIKPENFSDETFELFDQNRKPIKFNEIPIIIKMFPEISYSLPFTKPLKANAHYIYPFWNEMKEHEGSSWI